MNDELITAYLLQELSEEEAERFEEECFAQEEWPAKLDAVELDLIDAYLRNRLSREQRRHFKENYLITNARKARFLLAESFLNVIPPQRKTFPEKLQRILQWPLVPQTAVAILILAVMVPVSYLWLSRKPYTKTYSHLDLAMAAPDRGSNGPETKIIKLPLSTDGLKIDLELPKQPQSGPTYRVEWGNSRKTLGALPIDSQTDQSVVVIIWANQLSPDRYVLKLFKTNRGEAEQIVGSYFFNAEELPRGSDTNRQ